MVEKDLKKLESLVKTLEAGELSLEENIQLFQEGMELIGKCKESLEKAELRVKEVIAKQGGEFVEKDLTDS